ncbi:MAG: DUF1559 domain-containing protein [Gemmataceae bacterium]|nr:DUF1559 domain-containing protein [Gemmataceae bacterium]
MDDAELKKLAAKGKKKIRDDDDDGESEKKKSKDSSKFSLGIVLAVVGLLVLGTAAFFILRGRGGSSNNNAPPIVQNQNQNQGVPAPIGENKEKPNVPVAEPPAANANSGLTNLLPNDVEHVFHLFPKDLFDPASPFRDAVFHTPGALQDDLLKKNLGFNVLAIDDLIRAEKLSSPSWSFTVVHLLENVDMDALKSALALENASPAVKNYAYFKATTRNPWFEALARIAVGVPLSLRNLQNQNGIRPVYVHLHNPQTLIFADEAPMLAFLKADKQFRFQSEKQVQPAAPDPNQPPMGFPPGMMPPGMMPPGGGAPPGGKPPAAGNVSRLDLPADGAGNNFVVFQDRGGNNLTGTTWTGSETLTNYDQLQFTFNAGGQATMVDADGASQGRWNQNGASVTITFAGGIVYRGTITGNSMAGTATNTRDNWRWTVTKQGGGAPVGQPPVQPPVGVPPVQPPGGMMGMAGKPPMMVPPGGMMGMAGKPPMMVPPGGMLGMAGSPPMMVPPGGMMGQIGGPVAVPGLGQMGGGQPPAPQTVVLASDTYMTIKPSLKAVLDRMEATSAPNEKVLFSSATDMDAAKVSVKTPDGRTKNHWQGRQVWDVSLMLQERNPRIRTLGVALVQRTDRIFRLKNEMSCPVDGDARDIDKAMREETCRDIARFLDHFLGLKVDLPKDDGPQGVDPNLPGGAFPPGMFPPGMFPPGGGPPGMIPPAGPPPGMIPPGGGRFPPGAGLIPPPGAPGAFPPGGIGGEAGDLPGGLIPGGGINPNQIKKDDELPTSSRILLSQTGKTVELTIDLVVDQATLSRLHGTAVLLALSVRAEIDLVAGFISRHDLAKAGKLLPEKGLSDRQVPPGQYPPGAFKRPAGALRLAREPNHRVSWMAGLLPFLGHDTLYSRINFESSWRDPSNWAAGNTVVPQFLDPNYPLSAFFVSRADVPFDLAATHFVGIAGIGLDAADYPPDDPAYLTKRGVLGYEKGAKLDDVREGRGLSNAILMIQVPHDSLIGPTPWIAGGGSTLRGVPEKNSVAPFVLSADKNGKPITHNGKRGTYAVMTDGSVRFIDQNVSDAVFKAMATMKGPAAENWDINTDENTPLVAPPKVVTPKVEAPAKKENIAPKQSDPVSTIQGSNKLPADWIEFAPENENLSVALPKQPVPLIVKDEAGKETGVKLFTTDIYTIRIAPVDARQGDLSQNWSNMKKQFGNNLNKTVKSDRDIKLAGIPGKEVVVELTDLENPKKVMTIVTRLAEVEGRMISLTAGYYSDQDAGLVEAFFNSFKLKK